MEAVFRARVEAMYPDGWWYFIVDRSEPFRRLATGEYESQPEALAAACAAIKALNGEPVDGTSP
jgi:hypothetical protein